MLSKRNYSTIKWTTIIKLCIFLNVSKYSNFIKRSIINWIIKYQYNDIPCSSVGGGGVNDKVGEGRFQPPSPNFPPLSTGTNRECSGVFPLGLYGISFNFCFCLHRSHAISVTVALLSFNKFLFSSCTMMLTT